MTSLSLSELQRKLQKLDLRTIQQATRKLILQERAIVFRKQDELELGQRPDGDIIGTYRDTDYMEFKKQINPLAGGNVDLILTGATKNALFIEAVGDNGFRLKSRDPKWPKLMAKYMESGDLERINEEAFNDIQSQEIAPNLIKELRKVTGIK